MVRPDPLVQGDAGAGAIVDLHDAEGVAGAPARLAAALPAMLDGLSDAGYRLTTVADLLGDTQASGTRA